MNISDLCTEIDRLVDDELDEAGRSELLRRLDTTPDGWRSCALAFLEAREFAQAARSWARDQAPTLLEMEAVDPTPRRRTGGLMRLAVAATVAGLAFATGFAAGGRTASPIVVERMPTPVETAPAPSQGAVEPSQLAESARPSPLSDYVRALWERSGYQVEPAQKFVSLGLDDGRRVTIPVEGVQFQFVGRQTY